MSVDVRTETYRALPAIEDDNNDNEVTFSDYSEIEDDVYEHEDDNLELLSSSQAYGSAPDEEDIDALYPPTPSPLTLPYRSDRVIEREEEREREKEGVRGRQQER